MVATYEGLLLPRYRRRLALGTLVLVYGVQAIVTQALLLREAVVLMFGSEFAWGVVLFAWLLGVSIGALAGGWTARGGRTEIRLVAVLLSLSAAMCVELWVFRGARAWLGVTSGELVPLAKSAVAALSFVTPVGALVGMGFPLACRIRDETALGRSAEVEHTQKPGRPLGALGDVYALESAGGLVGGALFSFWAVEHLAPIETALLCAGLTAASCGGLLAATSSRRTGPVILFGLALAEMLAALLGGASLDRILVERRWRDLAPEYERCAELESRHQNLAVGRRGGQYTLYGDGQVAADFPDPYTFVPLAHFWMCQHPAPRCVLLLGGGAEGLLAEILRHPVERVDYVEPDPRQIEIIAPYLTDADRAALADERVSVHHVDGRYFVKTRRAQYDLVIARLPEPMSALRARFYTVEFYRELRRAMAPRAVVCLTVAAAPSELPPESGEYLASVRAGLAGYFPQVAVCWGDPAHVIAATDTGLASTDPATLAQRYTDRGVESPLFYPEWFEGATDWLDPDKLRYRAEELDAVRTVDVSTDLRPVAYVQRLVLWDHMTGGSGAGVIERLRSISLSKLCLGLALLGAITVILTRSRRRSADGWRAGATMLSIGTTGFATMALSVVWLFAFQNLYGYVYSRIGWIIAVFMGGLVVGCRLAAWRAQRMAPQGRTPTSLWGALAAVDGALALLALSIPVVVPALGKLQSTPLTFVLVEWAVLSMVALTGVLGGAAFALAGSLQLTLTGDAARAAGGINAADHAGACLGALLTGIVLVPVFGTVTAALLLAGLKLTSAAVLTFAWRLTARR
ncbi:MAG: hypothetical protein GY842_05735 [bacterium]|nr:hypothetical protein [bacterium]